MIFKAIDGTLIGTPTPAMDLGVMAIRGTPYSLVLQNCQQSLEYADYLLQMSKSTPPRKKGDVLGMTLNFI